MVKECSSDVIQMSVKREEALALLVVPHFDFIIITARNKKGLIIVKVDASDRPFVLLEFVNKSACSVVPELDYAGVQAR